jgi:hypothetical protein
VDSSNKGCATCAKGNEQGNGSDYIHVGEGGAWFIGAQNTIKYCIALSADFGVDRARAEQAVAGAFERWSAYMTKKHVYTRVSEAGRLAVKTEYLHACNGSEDLKFYLGLQPPHSAWQGQEAASVAKSVRTSYDLFKGWGKGFIWLTPPGTVVPDYSPETSDFPNWRLDENLDIILTHELGHVYGVEHVENTVMRYNIANFLKRFPGDKLALPLSIDYAEELKVCGDCVMNFRGSLGWVTMENGKITRNMPAENFELLTGQKPAGNGENIYGNIRGDKKSGFSLEISDGVNTFSFPVEFNFENSLSFSDSAKIFHYSKSTQVNANTVATMNNLVARGGGTTPGKIVTKSGVTLELSLNRNMMATAPPPDNDYQHRAPILGPLNISYILNGQIRPLLMVNAAELNK